MYCNQCGSVIQDGKSFCPNCGVQVYPTITQQSAYHNSAHPQPLVINFVQPVRRNGFAVAGLVLGIIALCLFWLPGINVILALLGMIFSVVGVVKRGVGGKGKAITGLVLSLIGLLFSFIIFAALSSSSNSNYNSPTISGIATTAETTSFSTTIITSETTED